MLFVLQILACQNSYHLCMANIWELHPKVYQFLPRASMLTHLLSQVCAAVTQGKLPLYSCCAQVCPTAELSYFATLHKMQFNKILCFPQPDCKSTGPLKHNWDHE